ncbi:MAG: ribosome silencing factor [Candidatus Marinimicrobia bacterium]|nr:ribosome silencing factor [Candidatus Neomarinimicrobiota bacterium]MDD5581608.1 ribosome silencing factor [Candidatus Neomarinimicrobiota bacterium]
MADIKKTKKKKYTSHEIAHLISQAADSKKAEDIVILDMKKVADFTDYFVICHGTSNMQVKAICDAIEETLLKYDIKYWHREGYENQQWILLDYIDVVCHIFNQSKRSYYNLEKLWADADIEKIES